MSIEQRLQNEIQESKRWVDIEKEDTTYKRDLAKRIELINWILEKMNNPYIPICEVIESKITSFILEINQTQDIFEADKLHSEWSKGKNKFLYRLCDINNSQIKR
jgi:hypothetical protein